MLQAHPRTPEVGTVDHGCGVPSDNRERRVPVVEIDVVHVWKMDVEHGSWMYKVLSARGGHRVHTGRVRRLVVRCICCCHCFSCQW